MSVVKTAISIEESTYTRAEEMARKLHLTRSGLYTRAIEEYLARQRREELIAQLDAAYPADPDEEQRAALEEERAVSLAMRRYFPRDTEGDEW
jgi:metal-responsive CopG/Arc/MetJ family transcriptional regulator